jgi:microcystin-dependent protein
MANLTETPTFDTGIYQLELTDPVVGGPNGTSNMQAKGLANRTKYLFDKLVNSGLNGSPRQFSGDVNTLLSPGFYLIRADSTNMPVTGKFGHMFVSGDAAAPDQNGQGASVCQLFILNNSDVSEIYFRVHRQTSGLPGWSKLVASSDLDAISGQLVGMVSPFGGAAAPFGWFECNGAAVSRSTYAALFTRIGTTHGAGNGTTTFTLPDLRGEFVRGWDHGRGVDSGRAVASTQADEIKSHNHGFTKPGPDTPQVLVDTIGGANFVVPTGQLITTTNNTGGTETRPRNVALIHCIKY